MTLARLILSLIVLLFAAYIVVMNWGCVIVSWRNRRRGIDKYHSTVPLFSLFVTVIALLIYPHSPDVPKGSPNRAAWMFLVPLLDIGNWLPLLGVLWLPVVLIREWRTK